MEKHSFPLPQGGTEKRSGWTLRVLEVENHADTAETTAFLLRWYGCEVLTAADGPTALEVARTSPPDVILLDLGLPTMSGWEVAARLHQGRGRAKRPLLVAVSGYGREIDKRRSSEAGIDLHLVKPVDPDHLLRLLAGARAAINP